MYTCRMKEALSHCVPPDVLPTVEGHFDVIPRVTRVEIVGLDPIPDQALEFGDGLTILCGPGGSGKTRVLEYLKTLGDLPPSLRPVQPFLALDGPFSNAERLLFGADMILAGTDTSACLLADDLLPALTRWHAAQLLELFANADRQSILAVKDVDLPTVRESLEDEQYRLVEFNGSAEADR